MAFKPSHLLLSLCMISPLLATTATWTGVDFNASWSDPGNWSPASVPVAGQDLVFPSVASFFIVSQDLGVTAGPFPTMTVNGDYNFFFASSPIELGNSGLPATFTTTPVSTGALFFNPFVLDTPGLNLVAPPSPAASLFLAPFSENSPSSLNISGGGSVEIDSFLGPSSYSGGTTVTGPGTILNFSDDTVLGIANTPLTLNAGATLAPDGGAIVLSARPVFLGVGTQFINTAFGNLTIPGLLSGPGNLTLLGGGALFLPNPNPGYFGNTSLNFGSVIFGSNTSFGNGTISFDVNPGNDLIPSANVAIANPIVLNVAGLIQTNGFTITLNGPISGVGALSLGISSSDTFIMNAANLYTGATALNFGTLVLNGSSLSATTVAAGATLKGTGVLANSLIVSGKLRPGNSVGTLTVTGPVTFNTGSTYIEELNPVQASLLNVTASSVTINSGVTLSVIPDPGPGQYMLDTTFTIIHTAGGVSGKFASEVVSPFPLLQFVPSYTANDVLLTIQKIPNAFSMFVPNGNAGAVAACLDQASPTPGTDFDAVVSALLFVPSTETLAHDLNQMQPSQFNAFQLTQENLNTRVFSVLTQRSGQLHRACKPQEQTWGLWGDVFGDFMQQNRERHQYGFHAASGGALLGLDGHASPHFHVGIGGAYTWTNLEWAGAHGHGEISSGYGFAYGSWHRPRLFLDAAFVGGSNHYEATRYISFLSFNRHAKSNHHGYTLAGRVLFGIPYKAKKTEVAPIASVDYDFVHQNSFTERNAKSLNLHVRGKNANMLRAEAGIRITRRCAEEVVEEKPVKKHRGYSLFAPPQPKVQSTSTKYSNARWLPSLQLTAIREWRFEGKHIKSNLVDSNCTMTTTGLNPVRTLISPAVGVTCLMDKDRINFTIDYAGEFSVDGKYWDQKGNLQLSYAF